MTGKFIARKYINLLEKYLADFPAIGIIGPRQIGKTTFVKQFLQTFPKEYIYLDLELNSDLLKLSDAELFLKQNEHKLVVIDEVQRKKELFPLLRALIDQNNVPARFILLGSATPELIRDTSESLAGRIIYMNIYPFDIKEIKGIKAIDDLWFRGGFPKSILAKNDESSRDWMGSFIRTYLERDLPLLGLNVSPKTIEKLWVMLAHLNGQVLNYSLISKSLEISSTTVKSYIDFLENAFLINRLYPYYYNISKRLIKSPKIYLSDTGILHHLLSIKDLSSLQGFHAVGNSWESFVYNQIMCSLNKNVKTYFYRTRDGSELDLVFESGGELICSVEVKYSNSPNITKGNWIAFDDLKSKHNFILTPTSDDFPIKENVQVCSFHKFVEHYIPKLFD